MDADLRLAFLDRLRRLNAVMDEAYAQAAAGWGFSCNGCEESCCRTRFHHHTAIEYLYLREGFGRLPAVRQAEVLGQAAAVVDRHARDLAAGQDSRPMCPLNTEGRCGLYEYRPMICRLHGLPHLVCPPGQPAARSPGCHEFELRCGREAGSPLDRTAHYTALARLEDELQRALGRRRRIKMTIAEMLLDGGVLA